MMHTIVRHLLTFGGMIAAAKAVSALIGALIAYSQDPQVTGTRNVAGFARYCVPKGLARNRHLWIDICFAVLTRFTSAFFVAPIVLTILAIVPLVHAGLTDLLGVRTPHDSTIGLQIGLVIVCIIARDFMEFSSHALSHRWQVLWEFHRVHHSSEFLTPFGEKRSHFMDDLWRNASIAVVVGICVAIYTYAAGIPPIHATLFGIPAYIFAYTIANLLNFEVLHHSHIPLSYGVFERALISPAQHQLHHNREAPSRNYGSFLAVWDRMFGSFAHSVPRGSFELGLPYAEQRECMNVPELFVRPFIRVGSLITRSAMTVIKSAAHRSAPLHINTVSAPQSSIPPLSTQQDLIVSHGATTAEAA